MGGVNPSEKNESQLGLLFPIYGKHKKCSTPPTRHIYGLIWGYWPIYDQGESPRPSNRWIIVAYPLVNTQKAIENGPVEIVDFPIKNGGSFHSYVKLPEGKTSFSYGFPMVFPLKPPFSATSGGSPSRSSQGFQVVGTCINSRQLRCPNRARDLSYEVWPN